MLLLLGLVVFLEKRGQKRKDVGSNSSTTGQHQQKRATIKAAAGSSYPGEDKRRAAEQAYWNRQLQLNWLSIAVSFVAAIVAAGALFYTSIQADIAENQLAVTTRARLKLLDFASPNGARIGGEIPSLGTVIWFNFNVGYRNFGPSPAEDIFFELHVFVVGAGPSPKKTCEGDKRQARGFPANVVFPQEKGGDGFGVQVLFRDLQEQAAEVHTIQPSSPIYLGVIGCLVYHSGSKGDVYVTGFNGSLHPVGSQYGKPATYVPLYDILSKLVGNRPVKVGTEVKMEVRIDDVWVN